jgi:hypothetical protein
MKIIDGLLFLADTLLDDQFLKRRFVNPTLLAGDFTLDFTGGLFNASAREIVFSYGKRISRVK